MRILIHVVMPNEPFNTLLRKGTAPDLMKKILDAMKPEAAYFSDTNGHRSGYLIVHMESASQIPALAEPWFLNFNADCTFKIVMTAEDLGKSDLAAIGKKWG